MTNTIELFNNEKKFNPQVAFLPINENYLVFSYTPKGHKATLEMDGHKTKYISKLSNINKSEISDGKANLNTLFIEFLTKKNWDFTSCPNPDVFLVYPTKP